MSGVLAESSNLADKFGTATATTADADNEEVSLTPEQVIEELVQAWRNECLSPELLAHKFDIVDCVIDQLTAMAANLKHSRTKNCLRNRIHQLECDRIRYVLCAYLRARLDKIESAVHYYLRNNTIGDAERMSDEEKLFAQDYERSVNAHLHTSTLRHLPANVATVDYSLIGNKPSLEHPFVFARALTACECVLPDDQVVEMSPGECHLLPFGVVRDLLHSRTIALQ